MRGRTGPDRIAIATIQSLAPSFVFFAVVVLSILFVESPSSPTGQHEPLHGAGIRARRRDVLPPQEDRQVQVSRRLRTKEGRRRDPALQQGREGRTRTARSPARTHLNAEERERDELNPLYLYELFHTLTYARTAELQGRTIRRAAGCQSTWKPGAVP